MRRWLMILLMVFMPLQLSWAAVGAYCQHETGAAAQHFGHHEHQHRAASVEASKETSAKSTGSVDGDCSVCHLGAAPGLVSWHHRIALPVAGPTRFTYWLRYDSHIPSGLERPNRGLVA